MPKGLFSQTFCVLTSQDITIEQVADAVQAFDCLGMAPANPDWQLSGPSLVLAYRPEVNGKVAIDIVDHRWPDDMGDPKGDKTTFGAWSMGYFGPFTYPNGLLRAGQHAWNWQPGRTIVNDATGFLRIRLSYVFGGDPKAPVLPKNYQPLPELQLLTRVTQALLEIPGTLCYFNPGGEVLRDKDSLQTLLAECAGLEMPALPAWCNVRFFKLNDTWFLMDTVGNHQLDIPDLEVFFPLADYQPGSIDNYLRDVSIYLLDQGAKKIKDGDKIDGPGERELSWQVVEPADPTIDPPRPVFRLLPTKDKDTIAQMTQGK